MLVLSYKTIQGSRWWMIQYTMLSGEKVIHCEGSFFSPESAMIWAKENFRTK